MPYEISGNAEQPTRIIVINESDWSVEANQIVSGNYSLYLNSSGSKIVVGRLPDGQSIGFGGVSTLDWGDRAV